MQRGFTLLETLLTLAIITIGIAIATAWTMGTLDRGEHLSTVESMVSIMRSQQIAARADKNNSKHGIALFSDSYIVFEGDSLATASSSQNFSLHSDQQIDSIALNGSGTEVIFEKHSGETNTNGSFNITQTSISESYTITISPLGLVDWQ